MSPSPSFGEGEVFPRRTVDIEPVRLPMLYAVLQDHFDGRTVDLEEMDSGRTLDL